MHCSLKTIWIHVARRMISVMQIVEPITLVQRMTDSLVLNNAIELWPTVHKAASRAVIADGCLKDTCETLVLGLGQTVRIAGDQVRKGA